MFSRLILTSSRPFVTLYRSISSTSYLNMPIKVGDTLPSIKVHETTPKNEVNILDLFKGKKGVLFAVPGAFTPGCSKTHLPGYVTDYDKLKSEGYEVIACVSVNDAFVMSEWGDSAGATGKIRMLADPAGEFTKAVDLGFDATPILGNVRSKRYAMTVEDGVVKSLAVEPDSTGLTVSLSCNLLKKD